MEVFIYGIILIAFSIVGYYKFKWALILYVSLKVVLIKSMVLFHVPGLPLITLDRCMEFVLILLSFKNLNPFSNRFLGIKSNLLAKPWLLLLLAQIVVFLVHMSNFPNALKGLSMFIFEYIILFVLITSTLTQKKDLILQIKGLATVFLFVGLYGLFSKYAGVNPFIDFFAEKGRQFGNDNLVFTYGAEYRFGIANRVQSVVFHPIAYGGILAMMVPVITNQFLQTQNPSRYLLWYGLSILLILNLLFANSRAAVGMFALISLSSLYVYFFKERNKKNTLIIVLPLLAIMLFASFYFAEIKAWILQAANVWNADFQHGSTMPDRVGKLDYVWQQLKGHMIFGLGYGTVGQYIVQNDAGLGGAESFLLKQLLEAGLFGILSYSAFFCWALVLCIKQFMFSRKSEYVYLTFLIIGYFTFILLTGELDTFPFFVILLAVFSNLAKTTQTTEINND